MTEQILNYLLSSLPYLGLIYWFSYSISYINKLKKNGLDAINLYRYNAIPTSFTTIGVLGTFFGIIIGLWNFNVNTIDQSIPQLLKGLKTAFGTSILGIISSLIFARWCKNVLWKAEKESPSKVNDELSALISINESLKENRKSAKDDFQKLQSALIGDSDSSLSTHFSKLRNQLTDLISVNTTQNTSLSQIQLALGEDDETSLLTQIQKLRADQNEIAQSTNSNIKWIVNSMNKNNELIARKFDEFSELLAKNNTEMLVEVMKKATDEFNAQMSAIVEKLVQENFQELNSSVERMNDWQKENKEMISSLTSQFTKVSKDFQISSNSIMEITENTNKLTDNNSHLKTLIVELQKVMIEDTKYQELVNKLSSTIKTLKNNTESFDKTTEKLNVWVNNQMNFTDSVAQLLTRLEEIDKIKDINEVFWDDTKKQLNEGVSIIEKASDTLSKDLENINQEFYDRLNDTLQNLDTLIQRIIENYN